MEIAAVLGIYGAVISSVTLVWNIAKARPRVRVRLVVGGDGKDWGGYVSIQNSSAHAIRVTSISLMYQSRRLTACEWFRAAVRYRRPFHRIDWNRSPLGGAAMRGKLPVTINPHDEFHVIVPYEVMEELLAKSACGAIRAVVQDALWNDAYSNLYAEDERAILSRVTLFRRRAISRSDESAG